MASDPYVSTAYPVPVAAEPDVARLRRNADDLCLGRRGSHIDCAADVDHGRCGDPDGAPDHAAAKQRSCGKCRKYQGSKMSAFH
jgi:hypothetical protein